MTVSTTSSSIVVACTGASQYSFPFIGVSALYISVIYTTTTGTQTTVPTTAYTVSLNSPVTGQIWGYGGTISPVTPANYTSGTLTITRTLPLTQSAAISNQGNEYPIVTEQAIDIQCMENQQTAARTGSWRGPWSTNTIYNFGDIVVDGINGANTTNWYVCSNANTSGVWATDLAAGYWQLILNIQGIANPGTVAAGGDLTGSYPNPTIAKIQGTTVSGVTGTGNVVMSSALATYAPLASPTFTGTVTIPTPVAGSNTTVAASTAFLQSFIAPQGSFQSLKGIWASNTTVTYTASSVVTWNASGQPYLLTSYNQTLNSATSGAGGLDTGSTAASTWYYVWAIDGTSGTSVLMSLSSTAPTMPTGYTYKARIGTAYLDGSKNFRGFIQYGRKTQYVVGNNLSYLPVMATGTAGSVSTPTYVSVAVGSFVPPSASIIKIYTNTANGGNTIIAPNNSYGAISSATAPPFSTVVQNGTSTPYSVAIELLLESTNIYWATGTTNSMVCLGYEDNL